jgi:hypothetical protein
MINDTMDHPRFLKKIGAPNTVYFMWTPHLEARGDMEPFIPPVDQHRVLAEEKGYKLQMYAPGLYRVIGLTGEVVCTALRGRSAADRRLEELIEGEDDDSTGTIGEGEKAA